jgi:hypothetical protein
LKAKIARQWRRTLRAAVLPNGDVYIVNDNDSVDDNSGETRLINLGAILWRPVFPSEKFGAAEQPPFLDGPSSSIAPGARVYSAAL